MNAEQYKKLLHDYVAALKLKAIGAIGEEAEYNEAFKEAINYLQKNIRSDVFNLDDMGSSDEEVQAEQAAHIKLLHQFLDHAIDLKTKPPRFLEEAAAGVKASIIDSALKTKDQLYIYDAPEYLGIREKYVRGLLTDRHGLTDLDIQRMLELTGCKEKVKVLPLSVNGITAGLNLAQLDIDDKRNDKIIYNDEGEYYTIPLILKRPSDEKSATPNWLAVQVFYHPVSGEISYQMNDNSGLSKENQEIIEKAISSAFNDRPLVTEDEQHVPKVSIVCSEKPVDSNYSGYRAVYHLLANNEISRGNGVATDYIEADASDDDALVKQFFLAQLTDLQLPADIYRAFANQNQFKKPIVYDPRKVVVDEEVLTEFLENLHAEPVIAPTTVNESVTKGVGAYEAGQLISFPLGAKDASLDSIQYTQYFSEITDLVLTTGVPVPLMLLTHCDGEALKGLNNFLAVSDAMPINALQINIDIDEADVDVFVKNLQLALKNLSRHGLARLQISDSQNRLKASHYEQLLSFIAKEDIAIRIDLPDSFSTGHLQRLIDTTTAVNIRNKNSDSLKNALRQEKVVAKQTKERPIRSRGEIDFTQNLNTDVELQEDVKETVVVIPAETQQRKRKDYAGFERFTLYDLQEEIESQEDTAFAKFGTIAGGMSKEELVKYWHTLSGNITMGKLILAQGKPASSRVKFQPGMVQMGKQVVAVNPQFDGFTDASLARLIQFKDYFQDGINFDQLPAGFILIPDPTDARAVLLHYDSALESQALLAPKLDAKPAKDSLSIDTTDKLIADVRTEESLKLIWMSLQTKEEYSRVKSELFRKYVPELMALDPQQLATVITLCGGVDNFNYKTLTFIFENLPAAKQSYSEVYDENYEKQSLISIEWMQSNFPEFESRKQFVSLAHAIKPHAVAQHALYMVLEHDGASELKRLLVQSVNDYKLTDKELNGLLSVYDKFGSGGLEKLLAVWGQINEAVPLVKLPALIKNTSEYERLLVNDEVLKAVQAISKFDSNKRQWWDQLYAAHTPQDDDFLSVYKNFNAFAQSVEQYGLTFYDLGKKDSKSLFQGAGNLPSTVGRMLSILNLCNPIDRKLQWEAMSEIDLSAQGALRAINYAKGTDRACGFVIPEMAISPKSALSAKLYDPQIKWSDVAGNVDLKDRPKCIYNYLAYQNHRLPLAFYKEALAKIDEFFPGIELDEAKKQLAALLLASTTGDNYRFYIDDPKAAMDQWVSILKEIQNVKAPLAAIAQGVQGTAAYQLYALNDIPPLPILARLTQLSMAPFHKITQADIGGAAFTKLVGGTSALEEKAKQLVECNKRLRKLLTNHHNTIYMGMKFYGDADYQQNPQEKTLFERHLDISEAIEKAEQGKYLLDQISTFHIASTDVEALATAIKFALGRKTVTRVYPQNHPKAGLEIPADEEQTGVLRNTLTMMKGRLAPLSTNGGALLHLSYLYPDGHANVGKPIPETIKAQLKEVHLYPDEHEKNGEIIPEDVDLTTIPNAVKGWVYVYPKDHDLEGQVIADIKAVSDKETLPTPPVFAVLKEVYFFPKGHAQENQPVPFDEVQPVGAVLKVAYCYPDSHPDKAGQMIEGKVFEVKKAQAHYLFPEGHPQAGKEDGSPMVVQLSATEIYPVGHPKAGQACDYFMETTTEDGETYSYRESIFATRLFNYAVAFLKDIESPDKPEGKGILTAEDLRQFFFALSDNLDGMVPMLEKKLAVALEAKQKELQVLRQQKNEIEAQVRSSDVIEDQVPQLIYRFQELALRIYDLQERETKEIGDQIFAEYGMPYKEKLLDFVEARLGSHFSKDYFAKQRAGEASPEIQLLINRAFVDGNIKLSVELIRKHYDGADIKKQIELVSLLEAICTDLSHTEKLQLFKFLEQPRLTEANIDDYLGLLKAINENGTSSFIYFVQNAEKFPQQPVSNLTEKATYFLAKALPQIRANENQYMSEVDVVNLVIDVVLAAKADELKSQIDINPLLTNAYSRLKSAIDNSDPNEIEKAIDNLNIYVKADAISDMSELKAHLIWLKTPEMEDYVITPATTKTIRVEKESRAGTVARALGALFGIKQVADIGYEDKVVPVPAVMGQKPMIKVLDKALLGRVSGTLDNITKELKFYTYAVGETFLLINTLAQKYPGAKSQILSNCRHYLSFNTTDGTQITESFNNIVKLKSEFDALNDQNLVIGLCENFGELGNENSPFNYQILLAIFKGEPPFAKYPTLDPSAKKQILSVINSLLNNEKPCTLDNIKDLVDNCADSKNGKLYQEMLQVVFENAPFPSFAALDGWFNEVTTTPPELPQTAIDVIREQYNLWSREPVERESVNGFDLKKAKEQATQMEGFSYTDDELEALDDAVNGPNGVRHLDTKDLIAEITAIRESEDLQKANRNDPTRLVALMAELLYRTKGLEAAPGELGRSFEINTTQYLAIHSMLKAGGHVTSQIGTGEGKSRIMMISLACQYAFGNTVDFVTADVSLATRDYLEYQSFFKSLGAETRLITGNMPADQYVVGGIHFSDPTNLSLFRNRAISEGDAKKVIDPNPKKRALMLDEADKTYFDCSDKRFNYSAQANPNIRGMEWIYELMVEFFSQEGNEQLYKTNADKCNEDFINFARGKLDGQPEKMARLEFNKKMPLPVVSRNQLEAWQNAALTALHLDLGNQFTIIKDVSLQTKQGTKLVTQAQLRADGRASGSAKISFGVHQCLHARLNMVRDGRLPNDKLAAPKYGMNNLEYPFYIDPETQIVYSSTNKSLIDPYSQGELLAVTGTAGSIREKEEAMHSFGQAGTPMTFIDMPRHRGQQRIDRPVMLANNQKDHEQKILKAVLAALEKNQPILLVCEDDNESERVHKFLRENLTAGQKANLTRISAETELKVESKYIEKTAGLAGAITVSTAMLGRGTDIKLHGIARGNGLNVIGTYLPRERDYWQIVGRAGRFGAKGETQFILDKEREAVRIKKYLGLDKIPIEFYTATQDYLKLLQEHMDSHAQRQRVVKDVVNDFRQGLTNQFFDDFKLSLPEGQDKDEVLVPWQQFVDKGDKLWNALFPEIQILLDKEPVDTEVINEQLSKYQLALQSEWTTMRVDFEARIDSGKIKPGEAGKQVVAHKLIAKLAPLALPPSVISLLAPRGEQRILQTPIANEYDPAFIGRAVIYTNFFDGVAAFFNNLGAAWNGDGPWFPNLKAAQNGNMSWSQFFLGSWGTPLVTAGVKAIEAPLVALGEEPAEVLADVDSDSYSKMEQRLGHSNTKRSVDQLDSDEDITHENQGGTPSALSQEGEEDAEREFEVEDDKQHLVQNRERIM